MTESTEDKAGSIECEFCGTGRQECKALVAGPKCYICDACVMMAVGAIGNRGLFDRWDQAAKRVVKLEAVCEDVLEYLLAYDHNDECNSLSDAERDLRKVLGKIEKVEA